MAEEFKIVEAGPDRVTVILHPHSTISQDAVLELLRECGIDPDIVVFLQPDEAIASSEEIQGCTLIPIDDATAGSEELEDAARCRAQGGGAVIVVFGEGYAPDGLHPIAVKYGTQCGWRSEELAPRINGVEGQDGPVDASGAPIDRPKSEQVKC